MQFRRSRDCSPAPRRGQAGPSATPEHEPVACERTLMQQALQQHREAIDTFAHVNVARVRCTLRSEEAGFVMTRASRRSWPHARLGFRYCDDAQTALLHSRSANSALAGCRRRRRMNCRGRAPHRSATTGGTPVDCFRCRGRFPSSKDAVATLSPCIDRSGALSISFQQVRGRRLAGDCESWGAERAPLQSFPGTRRFDFPAGLPVRATMIRRGRRCISHAIWLPATMMAFGKVEPARAPDRCSPSPDCQNLHIRQLARLAPRGRSRR
jgi:hypothetical protein